MAILPSPESLEIHNPNLVLSMYDQYSSLNNYLLYQLIQKLALLSDIYIDIYVYMYIYVHICIYIYIWPSYFEILQLKTVLKTEPSNHRLSHPLFNCHHIWYFPVHCLFISICLPHWLAPHWELPVHVVAVQSLSCVRLFATPWTAACQASLSLTISWSLTKFVSIESGMLSNHLILCCPLLLLPSIFPSIRVFSNESAVHYRSVNEWMNGWYGKMLIQPALWSNFYIFLFKFYSPSFTSILPFSYLLTSLDLPSKIISNLNWYL